MVVISRGGSIAGLNRAIARDPNLQKNYRQKSLARFLKNAHQGLYVFSGSKTRFVNNDRLISPGQETLERV